MRPCNVRKRGVASQVRLLLASLSVCQITVVPNCARANSYRTSHSLSLHAAKRATLIARAIWVLAHVLILAAIVFSRSQVHHDFNAGRPGPIILAFFIIGINFWLYMWVSFSNPGVVQPPCACPHSRTGCQHGHSSQTGMVQASAASEAASGTIASTRSLAPANPPGQPSAAGPDSHWHTPASTPNRRESLASASTTNQTPMSAPRLFLPISMNLCAYLLAAGIMPVISARCTANPFACCCSMAHSTHAGDGLPIRPLLVRPRLTAVLRPCACYRRCRR